jgi:hypothetical protein
MSLGNFAVSMFTGKNENTLALANINVDFSLFRVNAPKVCM